jgi:DNA-binding SARP family transcriptional activator
VLIDAQVSAGNRVAALRQFEQCKALLAAELGLQPGEALAASAARAYGPAAMTKTVRKLLTGMEAGTR